MTPDDDTLLRRVREGDEDAFEALRVRHQETLRRHVVSIVRDEAAAEDLLQEVLLRVWTHAGQWDGRGAAKAWLFRIATNLALNHLRARRRRREQPLDMPAPFSAGEEEPTVPAWAIDTAAPGPEEQVIVWQQQRHLRELVEGLPERKRVVFQMMQEAEMDLRGTADALGIPPGTVKSRLHAARRHLIPEWVAWEHEEENPEP